MSLTLLGCILVVASAAVSALFVFRPRSDVARRDLLSRLRSSSWRFGQGNAGMWIVPAVVFLLIAGVGAAVSTMRDASEATGSRDTTSSSMPRSGSNGDMLARLKDYARSAGTEEPAHTAPTGKPLPDVNTMIERLAARLETAPDDIKGWRMLGWSYFNTGRYEQAAAAYAKAAALDPNSSELKFSYEEAKAKASGAASIPQAGAAGNGGDNLHVAKGIRPEAIPPTGQDAAIRAMVDGLAGRLERSPHDVDGWARLMRSRVVLGEREVATTAFRKALEVFKGDQAATGRLTSAAIELGLKAE
jgi:cytochrome c-type biogenesis protein CcmH/NrfG